MRARGCEGSPRGHTCRWLTFSATVLLLGAPAPLPPLALQDLQPVVLLELQDGQCDLVPERRAWAAHGASGHGARALPTRPPLLPVSTMSPGSALYTSESDHCSPATMPSHAHCTPGQIGRGPPCSRLSSPPRLFSTQQPEGQFQKHSETTPLSYLQLSSGFPML